MDEPMQTAKEWLKELRSHDGGGVGSSEPHARVFWWDLEALIRTVRRKAWVEATKAECPCCNNNLPMDAIDGNRHDNGRLCLSRFTNDLIAKHDADAKSDEKPPLQVELDKRPSPQPLRRARPNVYRPEVKYGG